LAEKHVPKISNIDIGGTDIQTKSSVRYLGVLLDNARRYSPHLEQVCGKAEAFAGAIRSLLPKINGPISSVKKYYAVWESVVLHATPVWASVLSYEKNRKILKSAQRARLVRTSTAYKTVSHAALCVVTGSMSIHIKTRQREKEFTFKKSLPHSADKICRIYKKNL
jgi:hypothetical protein